jgi:hypothetical protein
MVAIEPKNKTAATHSVVQQESFHPATNPDRLVSYFGDQSLFTNRSSPPPKGETNHSFSKTQNDSEV